MPSFEDFKFNKQILNAITETGYATPTPIQEKAIPLCMAGHDVLGIAQTGTGKTAAYLLPVIMKIKYAVGLHPRAVIFAPTRELVRQIYDEAIKFAKHTDLRIACLYGGIGTKAQIDSLRLGIDIIVATPGRFLDLYGEGEIWTKEIKTLVLDEADKMMDMGFMPQIRRVLEVLPTKKQKLLFSATFPDKVEELSHEFLEYPEKAIATEQATPAETVEQHLYNTPNQKTKLNLLKYFFDHEQGFERVIIFCRTKASAKTVYDFIYSKVEKNIRILHSNKDQNTRMKAIDDFKEGEVRALITTDVSSRGIDVSMVSHVINFEVPVIFEDYVHRIGRTGRAHNAGKAYTFCNDADMYYFHRIEGIIRMKVPLTPIPEEVEIAKTPFIENQIMLRELDDQKRKSDPDFKGAFHEKRGKKAKYAAIKERNASKKGGRNKR